MTFNQANSRQIKPGSLDNTHIKAGAGIDESKLVIDWAAHGASILASKLLVDYVQVDGKAIPSASSKITVPEISGTVAILDTERGVVVQTGKNKVILREAVTGDPVISVDGTEVYGRLTYTGSQYELTFFYKDITEAEKPHTFTEAATIDFQYPQRFDLNTIAESFAANEKFVDGASDVSSRLDLEQIGKDTFGPAYDLTQDGAAKRPKSLVTEIAERTAGTTNTGVTASTVIDEVIAARGAGADLSARLGSMASSISAIEGSTHGHYAEDKQVLAGDPLISSSRYDVTTGTFIVGDKSLNVYINGMLQMAGVHYQEVANQGGEGIAITFTPELIVENMVIQLRWTK